MPKDDASFASAGRLFHNFTPRYEKPLCPIKDAFLGILRSVDVLRRVRASPAEFLVNRQPKYCGAKSLETYRLLC